MILIGQSQTFLPSPGDNITVTIGGSTYKAFAPDDYLTCDSTKLRFHVYFSGDGETDGPSTEGTVMGSRVSATGDNWDGRVFMNNGDTLRLIVFSVPNYGVQPDKYATAINDAIASFTRFDNTQVSYFSIGGLSGGPGRAINWIRNGTSGWESSFKRTQFSSPTTQSGPWDWSAGGYHWVWYSSSDPNGGTPPSAATGMYTNLQGVKKITAIDVACHCNTIWDSAMTIYGLDSHTGGTAETNRIRFLMDPEDGIILENKITDIKFSDIIDFQGGSGNPWTFFNEQTSIDPENNITTAAPNRTLPSDSKYFPVYQGSQWRFAVDLRAQYHIKKIWYYVANNNGFYDDTLFIFKTSDFLTLEKIDSIRIPVPTTTGWYSRVIDDTTRYLVFGLKRLMDNNPNGSRSPEVTEIIPYGDLLAGETREDPLPDTYQGVKRPKKTIDSLVGIGIIGGYEPMHNFSDFAHVRIMNERFYLDDSTNSNGLIDKKFNGDHFNEYNGSAPWRSMFNLLDSLHYITTTNFITQELNGASQKVNNQYGSTLGWPVNNYGDDPLNPNSYTESGYMFWNLVAQRGSVPIDSNRLRIFRTPRYTGQNFNESITNGSEINRYWGATDTSSSGWRYMTALQYVIHTQVDFDGFETSYGDSIGGANADPAFKLGYAADYQIDSILLNSRYKLATAMRSDGVNPWGTFQFNEYPEKDYGGGLGVHGMHALDYDVESHFGAIEDYAYRLDPNWLIMCTENGFDANTASNKSTPLRTNSVWTDREWQAINLGWNISQVSKTHVDKYFIYIMVTNASESNGGTFQTSDIMSSFPSVVYKPPYYYVRNLIRTMKGYRHDSTIATQWRGLNIERFRNVNNSDSVAFLVGYADTTGITYNNTSISLPGIPDGTVKVVDLSFTSFTNTEENISVSSQSTIYDVGEKLFVILASESGFQPPSPPSGRYKIRKKIKYLN